MSETLDATLRFLARLLETESLPGHEGEAARLVVDEMRRVGYDEVRVDEMGSVIGLLRGRGAAPPLLFATHLDHVDVGDVAAWPYPPFAAEVHGGEIWGRGACDIKGPLAAQVHAVGSLAGGERPPGDVWVAATVQEEVGGVGARHLAPRLEAQWVVIGEPSGNRIRRGHRGRVELEVRFTGRSAHASAPDRGANPLYALGRFLERVEGLEHHRDPELGASSVAPTLLRTDQTSPNVIPAEALLTCDWRNVPSESHEAARDRLAELARRAAGDGVLSAVEIATVERRTYTGVSVTIPAVNYPYLLTADHPAVTAAAAIVERTLDRPAGDGFWRFATDGGHFARAGRAPIGFGPGDEALAHTVDERISIAELDEALEVNRRLALELAPAAAG